MSKCIHEPYDNEDSNAKHCKKCGMCIRQCLDCKKWLYANQTNKHKKICSGKKIEFNKNNIQIIPGKNIIMDIHKINYLELNGMYILSKLKEY